MMLCFANPKTTAAVIKQFDDCGAHFDKIGLFIAEFGVTYGAKAQAMLINTLYLLAQQRGYIVSGAPSLGNTISIQQNDAVQRLTHPRCLSERQIAVIVGDLLQYAKEVRRAENA